VATFGWDISTSVIGVSAFDEKKQFLGSSFLDLRKMDDILKKGEAAEFFIRQQVARWGINGPNTHYVEDRLAGFSAGFTSRQTLMLLGAFNLLVTWFIHLVDSDIRKLHPSTVKAIMRKQGLVLEKGDDKKMKTLKFVESREKKTWKTDLNRNMKPQPWMYDMADSYITGLAGIIRDGKI
jgi:hypothetical protein